MREEWTGNTLAGVKVIARREAVELVTDDKGNFRLKGVRAGFLDLLVEKDSYESKTLHVLIPPKTKEKSVVIVLKPIASSFISK